MNDMDINSFFQLDRHDRYLQTGPGMPPFSELARRAISGEMFTGMPELLQAGLEIIFAEFFAAAGLIRNLIIIAILSALLRSLTDAFTHKSAGETGFYVTYLLAVIIAVNSFHISVDVLRGLVSATGIIMQAAIPIMVGLMAAGGNVTGAAGFHPLLFFALQLISRFISGMFIPLVLASAAMSIVSQISDIKLDKLVDLMRKIADWTLKAIVASFAFLLTVQRITAPAINNAALRTGRNAAGAVPVVGSALSAAVDTVVGFGQVARSGALVALVIVLASAMAAPLIKMLVLSLIYSLTTGLIQPIADSRLVGLMDSMGKSLGHLFSAGVLIGVMCLYTVIILLSF